MPGYALQVPIQRSVSAPLWAALRADRTPRSIAELHRRTHAAPGSIHLRLHRWARAGFVNVIAGRPQRFVMSDTAPAGQRPPLVNAAAKPRSPRTSRQRLWAAMRVLKTFDTPLLMMTAEVSRRSAEDFVDLLRRAGYVQLLGYSTTTRAAAPGEDRPGRGGKAASRANLASARDWSSYRLVRSTGPQCPTITKPRGAERQLVDPNNGTRTTLVRSLRECAREVNHVR